VTKHRVQHILGISFPLTGLTYQIALRTRCNHYSWALQGLSPVIIHCSAFGARLTPFRSKVNLSICRERGAPLESFDVQRNYSSSVLGHSISENQELHLEHLLVRDASSSLDLQRQQAVVNAAFRSHSATSSVSVPLLVPANKAAGATAPIAATVLSPAPAVSDMVAESKKKTSPDVPLLPAFVSPLKQWQDNLWSELKNEQLQRATRCCSELLQRALCNSRQIDALQALCERQQRELRQAKARPCSGVPSMRSFCDSNF
jgi:hypothetical protein